MSGATGSLCRGWQSLEAHGFCPALSTGVLSLSPLPRPSLPLPLSSLPTPPSTRSGRPRETTAHLVELPALPAPAHQGLHVAAHQEGGEDQEDEGRREEEAEAHPPGEGERQTEGERGPLPGQTSVPSHTPGPAGSEWAAGQSLLERGSGGLGLPGGPSWSLCTPPCCRGLAGPGSLEEGTAVLLTEPGLPGT